MLNRIWAWRAPKPLPPRLPGFPRYRVPPAVKASLHADGVVIFHSERGTVFSANRVGAMIWSSVAEQRSFNQVSESISAEFHVPPQIIHQDAEEFLAQLAAQGLLAPTEN